MSGVGEMEELYDAVRGDPEKVGPGDAEGIISPVEPSQRNDSGVVLRTSLEIPLEDGVSHVGVSDETDLDDQTGGHM